MKDMKMKKEIVSFIIETYNKNKSTKWKIRLSF